MPLVPFFAAVLKVRLPRMGAFADINLMFTDVRFHGARPNFKQDNSITRPFTLLQEP